MKIFFTIGQWIKSHVITTIIIGIATTAAVVTPIVLVNKNDIFGNRSNYLANGTYSCDIQIDGYDLSSDKGKDIFIERISLLFPESTGNFDKNSFDESELNAIRQSVTATKDEDYITLNINGGDGSGSIKYKISDSKLTLDLPDKLTDKELNFISKMKVSYDSKGITFEKFLNMIYIYPNFRINNSHEYDDTIDKAFDFSLGDLVCRTKIPTDEVTQEDKVTNFNAVETYKEILNSYSDYLYNYGKNGDILLGTPGWYNYFDMSKNDKYCNSNYVDDQIDCEDISNVRTYLSYSYFDLDGDGVEELIISQHGSYYDSNPYSPSNMIMAIYYYDKEVKNLYLAPQGEGTGITLLEDGYLKYYGGRQGYYTTSYMKKGKSWAKLENVITFQTQEDENHGVTYIIKESGKKDVVHKGITWDSLGNYEKTSYEATGKYELNLNSLDWENIILVG